MTDNYLLTKLVERSTAVRKAQRDYYAYKKPLDDPMKRSYLAEAQRREQDLDSLLAMIIKGRPELAPASLAGQ